MDPAASGRPARRLRAVEPDASSPTAEDLLLAVARGDQRAYGRLYDRFAGPVYGVVHRVLREPAQSEEVAQEVLVEAWRAAARFDPGRGSASSWLLSIAHRRAVDRVRSGPVRRDGDQRAAGRDRARADDRVAADVERRPDRQQVGDALAELTDLQRDAVELAYYSGYTYREVAELLDTPHGTVRTRMRDGFIRLRDALGVSA